MERKSGFKAMPMCVFIITVKKQGEKKKKASKRINIREDLKCEYW